MEISKNKIKRTIMMKNNSYNNKHQSTKMKSLYKKRTSKII
jgi:hypothetical protein